MVMQAAAAVVGQRCAVGVLVLSPRQLACGVEMVTRLVLLRQVERAVAVLDENAEDPRPAVIRCPGPDPLFRVPITESDAHAAVGRVLRQSQVPVVRPAVAERAGRGAERVVGTGEIERQAASGDGDVGVLVGVVAVGGIDRVGDLGLLLAQRSRTA